MDSIDRGRWTVQFHRPCSGDAMMIPYMDVGRMVIEEPGCLKVEAVVIGPSREDIVGSIHVFRTIQIDRDVEVSASACDI